jgi:hypothetical protein
MVPSSAPVLVRLAGDAGIGQLPHIVRLGMEPGQNHRVMHVLGTEQLDRHRPVQHLVHGPPHFAHPTGRDQ